MPNISQHLAIEYPDVAAIRKDMVEKREIFEAAVQARDDLIKQYLRDGFHKDMIKKLFGITDWTFNKLVLEVEEDNRAQWGVSL